MNTGGWQIRVALNALNRQRRERIKALIADYDAQTYKPEKARLMAECAAMGHHYVRIHRGIVGGWWLQCHYCLCSQFQPGPDYR